MTDTTTQREKFEKWYQSQRKYTVDFNRFSIASDNYRSFTVNESWITWQAATANMQNKLDESKEEEDVSYQALMSVSKLLAQIAITLKGEELPLHLYSYHDLPELVEKMKLAKSELEAKIAELQKTIKNVFDVKGRHNTEIAMNRLKAIAEEGVK